jgi:hypothetical protein
MFHVKHGWWDWLLYPVVIIGLLIIALGLVLLIYILINEIRVLSQKIYHNMAVVRPRCPACGRRNQSRIILTRLFGSSGRWHEMRWRRDLSPQRLEVECWNCGANWAEMAITQKLQALEPSTWSQQQPMPQKNEENVS